MPWHQQLNGSLRKVKSIGTVIAFLGIVIALVDLLNAGAAAFSFYTGIPTEVIPKEAPDWVQHTYLAMIVAGTATRYLALAIISHKTN